MSATPMPRNSTPRVGDLLGHLQVRVEGKIRRFRQAPSRVRHPSLADEGFEKLAEVSAGQHHPTHLRREGLTV